METIQTTQPAKQVKFEFAVQSNWLSEDTSVLSTTGAKGIISVGTPQEFGGQGKEWSPEELLLGAVSSCFLSTYLSFVKKFRFEITRFACYTEGRVEMVDGVLAFTRIIIHPRIHVAKHDFMDKATLALEKAKKHCLVSNSLSATIECRGDVIEDKHS
jgi:peroxiredoxin-like protein